MMSEEKKLSIYDPFVMLHDRKTVFSRQNLLDEKVSIVIPEDFVLLDEATRRKIYAVSDTPGCLYSNEQGCFVLGLKQTETKLAENHYLCTRRHTNINRKSPLKWKKEKTWATFCCGRHCVQSALR